MKKLDSQRGVGLVERPRANDDKGADELHAVGDVDEGREHQAVEVGPEQGPEGCACEHRYKQCKHTYVKTVVINRRASVKTPKL